jgi:hypothetical protein
MVLYELCLLGLLYIKNEISYFISPFKLLLAVLISGTNISLWFSSQFNVVLDTKFPMNYQQFAFFHESSPQRLMCYRSTCICYKRCKTYMVNTKMNCTHLAIGACIELPSFAFMESEQAAAHDASPAARLLAPPPAPLVRRISSSYPPGPEATPLSASRRRPSPRPGGASLRVQAAALSMSSDEPNSKCTCRGCELNCRGRRRRRGYPLNLGLVKS